MPCKLLKHTHIPIERESERERKYFIFVGNINLWTQREKSDHCVIFLPPSRLKDLNETAKPESKIVSHLTTQDVQSRHREN